MDEKPSTSLQTVSRNSSLEESSLRPSYYQQWLTQAGDDFTAKLRQEATFSGATGILLLIATIVLYCMGFSKAIALLPVGIFVAVVTGYYVFVLFRSPKKLDERRRGEIEGLSQQKTDSLIVTAELTRLENENAILLRERETERDAQKGRERMAGKQEQLKSAKREQELVVQLTEGKAEIASLTKEKESLNAQLDEIRARPKLMGFFQDVSIQSSFEFPPPDKDIRFAQPLKVTGTSIAIFVRIVNEHAIPTTVHNFSLLAECEGKKCLARYPEEPQTPSDDDTVWTPPEIVAFDKRMTNLATYMGNVEREITQGKGVEGYLTFHLPDFLLPDENVPGGVPIVLTLGIEDAWGTYHLIKDTWGNQPRPSRRLRDGDY